MLLKVCNQHGKIGCNCGQKKPWAGSTRRKRLPKNWDRTRKRILRRDPYCKLRLVCRGAPSTQVDHIVRGDDHRDSNLQGVCGPCHRIKSSREGREAKGRSQASHIPVPAGGPALLVALVGAPGAGKSQVGLALQRKGYRYRSIDDCGSGGHTERWAKLLTWIDEQHGANVIVESNVIPPSLADRLKSRRSLVAELVVDEGQRRRQLRGRGDRWMRTVDARHPIDVQVSHPGADAEIERALERGLGRGG